MKSAKMAEGASVDPLLIALVHASGGDPDRLRRRLLDDAVLRGRYITPLIKRWCEETIKEYENGNL